MRPGFPTRYSLGENQFPHLATKGEKVSEERLQG